ncbi:hypothetical protein [Sphingobacterium griseoflavum]|uniref:Uncharacterized protein n=1 Tax=Sphingobacterium griseoflavum TaxID=1474952 RepID=A0ABQ3HZV8_9SPHI|nr:hypothetical protein [Sphingobacterium griseoflavum]GHE42314.1 hypothetical protein GCM10017764_26980 [Sphingobacterium griseoflavum]
MQIQELNINDTIVSQEDKTPVVTFNIDISILCDTTLDEFTVNGKLDTTSLKDAALRFFSQKIQQKDLDSDL